MFSSVRSCFMLFVGATTITGVRAHKHFKNEILATKLILFSGNLQVHRELLADT